tara:strand:+ start:145 stop:390 length:246 start_codon:yes stop_codon:yes gene_type:complete
MRSALLTLIIVLGLGVTHVHAKPPVKSKFYDFSEQLIDGEIKKPTALYTDSRQRVKFDRLLRLKKSFIPQLFNTAKERVFK